MTHQSPDRAAGTSSDGGATPEALHALLLGIGPHTDTWQPGTWPAGLPSLDRWPDAAVAREITTTAFRGPEEPSMDDPASWVSIHAWRWLAHRHAAEVIAPMLLVIAQPWDLHAYAEFPEICGLVGPAVIPVLEAVLRDPSRGDVARIAAIRGLVHASARPPSTWRAAVVKTLLAALSQEAEHSSQSEVGDELVEMLTTIAPAEFHAEWAPGDR
jgi:hypothetical protein